MRRALECLWGIVLVLGFRVGLVGVIVAGMEGA
jgi:hypothetical protein